MSDNDKLTDVKLYELAIERNKEIEKRREDINKYYTSLFTAIVSIMPFVDKIPLKEHGIMGVSKFDIVHILFCFLSVIALTLSISWVLTLKRICHNLEAIDKFLMKTEKKHNKSFISFLYEHLQQVNSPGKVTKNEMVVPYVFISIFILVLFYSIYILIIK